MEKPLVQIYQNLQKLMGFHCQLLEVVRKERESLVQADLKSIQSVTATKQALIEAIHVTETERVKLTGELAIFWKKPFRELTLPNIIIEIQGVDPKAADQLRSVYNTLTVLIQRISAQNLDNSMLIERSLEHIHQMKKNILGEANPRSNTYTQRGQRANGPQSPRLISREV